MFRKGDIVIYKDQKYKVVRDLGGVDVHITMIGLQPNTKGDIYVIYISRHLLQKEKIK